MVFQNPAFLWGLLAIAIPIAIHLFNFRRHKTVYFSSLRFLKAIQQETKSQSKLRHLLVLLARCLAIIALALAFAGPYIPGKNAENNRTVGQRVSLYLDNSFSTNAEGQEGQVLEAEKKRARSIVQAYGRNAQFFVFSNDFASIDEQKLNYDQALERIGTIRQSSSTHQMSEVVLRGRDLLRTETSGKKNHAVFYALSDFQKSITNLDATTNDTAVRVVLIPVNGHEANNLFVDSCWFESPIHAPQQPEQLSVKLRNSSKEDYTNIPVRLFINENMKAVASASLPAGGEAIVTLTYSNAQSGIQQGKIEIADFPVTFDNDYYFSYQIANEARVLCIAEDASPIRKYLNALFKNDPYCKLSFSNQSQIEYTKLATYQLIIVAAPQNAAGLSEQLRLYAESGGNLCIVPQLVGKPDDYNLLPMSCAGLQLAELDNTIQHLKKIDYKHPLFKSVFKRNDQSVLLPVVSAHYKLNTNKRTGYLTVLECENGDDFLVSCAVKKGNFYLFTSDLTGKEDNFTAHPLFVAAFYNMALLRQQSQALHYVIGKNSVVSLESQELEPDQIVHLRAQKGAFDVIPRSANDPQSKHCRVFVDNLIREAGIYSIALQDSAIAMPAFNYNRQESVLEFYSAEQLKDLLQTKGLQNISVYDKNADLLAESIRSTNQGTALWKWFIVLALLAIFTETALLLWKKK